MKTIRTDYSEMIRLAADQSGDIHLSITRDIPGAHPVRTDEAWLRPSQAELLAEAIFSLLGMGLDAPGRDPAVPR